jgi:hypothetical protein
MYPHLEQIRDELVGALERGSTAPLTGLTISKTGHSVLGQYKNRSLIVNMYAYNELHIKMDCSGTYFFQVAPNTLLLRLNILLAPRLRTHDKELDEKYIIRTYYRRQLKPLYSQTTMHTMIKNLEPFNALRFRHGLLRYITDYDFKRGTSKEILGKTEMLNQLAAALEELS